MLTGFGFSDTHTMVHSLVRGPGGWIHFSQGALNKGLVTSLQSNAALKIDYSKIVRFSLVGKKLDLVSSGLNNIWGFQLRDKGQWYGTEANDRSEEHTSELQSLMRISYAVFCLKKKKTRTK